MTKVRECPISLSGKHIWTLITTDTWTSPYEACGYCGLHKPKEPLREFFECLYENVLHEGDEDSPSDFASLRLGPTELDTDTDTLYVTLSNGVSYKVVVA